MKWSHWSKEGRGVGGRGGGGEPGDHGQVRLWERRTGPDTAAPLALLSPHTPPPSSTSTNLRVGLPLEESVCRRRGGGWWVGGGGGAGGVLKAAPVKAAAIIITPKGAELWRRNVCTELLQCV